MTRSDLPGDARRRPRKDARTRASTSKRRSGGRSRADGGSKAQVEGTSLDKASSGGRPARGYSWPPLQPGHTLSMVHGGTSPRAITARAQLVHAELLTVVPYLAEPKFAPAVDRYLKAAAREALLHEHIERLCAEKGPGAVPARVWEQATAAARLASKLGSDLGLDPIGHARIRALSAGAEATEASLADLAAEGRAIRERAEERHRAALAPVIDLQAADPEGDDVA